MSASSPSPESERSFERLYRRHRQDIYRYVLRDVGDPQDAEDVTQTAFMNAYRALRRGQPPAKPRAWLLTIARNVARRRFRTRRPETVALDELNVAAPDDFDGPTAAEIAAALRRLRPSQRNALVLREILGLSYTEIARELDVSVSAVETLIFRGRRSLREQLEPTRGAFRGILALPVWLQDLVGWFTRAGLVVRAAGVLGAAVIGSGVGLVGASPPEPAPPEDAGAPLAPLASGSSTSEAGLARAEALVRAAAVAAATAQPDGAPAGSTGGASAADGKKTVTITIDEGIAPVPLPGGSDPLPDVEVEIEIEPPPPPPLPDPDDIVPDPPPPPLPLPELEAPGAA